MHKPFLKFAGGKYKLLPQILDKLDKSKEIFVEPFLGSGAVFLNTKYSKYILADANPDLINVYTILQKEGLDFIADCEKYFQNKYNDSAIYYQLRTKFNTTSCLRTKAILFVYLNRHCFNGLCRYNQKKEFNVPFGKYASVYFPRSEMEFFWKKCTTEQVVFKCQDFTKTLAYLHKNAAIYCDPPYFALSDTANFTGYTSDKFEYLHQKKLALKLRALAKRGACVVASNHDVPETLKLYPFFCIEKINVYRAISASTRKAAPELLIWNKL